MSGRLSAYVETLERRAASGFAATPLYDHATSVPRAGNRAGYVKTTRGA